MRATGIVRRIDDLGRIVIPKEIRKTMHIRESDPLEIFTEKNGNIILKKYSPIGEMGIAAQQYADSIASSLPHTVCICDQDDVIAAAGPGAKKLIGKSLTEKAQLSLQERRHFLLKKSDPSFFSPVDDLSESISQMAFSTIISGGDAIGLVCILCDKESLSKTDLLITNISASFLGKQMED